MLNIVHGGDPSPIFTKHEVYFNFFTSLSYLEEKMDSKKSSDSVLRDAQLDWTYRGVFQETRALKAVVKTKEWRNARIKATEKTDVKMRLKDRQGELVVKQGIIAEVQENGSNTTLIIECRWDDDLSNNAQANT